MKKFLILPLAALLAACSSVVKDDGSSAKITGQPDARLADNARIELAAQGNAAALYVALQTEERKPLRDGIIYSLGCMQFEPARGIIEKEAVEGKSAAAVLALARYDGTEETLQKLADAGCPVAKSALFIKASAPTQKQARENVAKAEDTNDAVARIYSLCAKCPANLEFLLAYKAESDRAAEAQCNALSAMGGDAAARKILQIAAERPKLALQAQLGLCAGSTDAVVEALKAKNKTALRAVKEGRIGEAEPELLAQLDAAKCPEYRAELLDALEVVGGEATAKKFSAEFSKLPQSELKTFVKVMSQALSRCGGAAKSAALAKLGEVCKSESPYQKAAERIIKNK